MLFWAIAAAVAILVALLLARPLLSARRGAPSRAAHDVQVYRDQLQAVETDLDRGVLSEAEAEGARAEISRRLLIASDKADTATGARAAPAGLSRTVALLAVVLIGGATFGLYLHLGAPGLRDQPLTARLAEMRDTAANRPDQATAERLIAEDRAARGEPMGPEVPAETMALIDRLRAVVADRPTDVRGRRLLANALLGVGRPAEAARVFDELIPLLGDSAMAEDYSTAAEAMILAAGGYVSPQAESALGHALQRDPEEPRARYYAGLSLAQNGRADLALSIWRRLLEEGPEDAPWIAPIRDQIDELAAFAGQPGPSREDMEAAEAMTAEERREMIAGMVARLEDRLATEGGPPADWARLIRALGVLGRAEDAARIRAEAEALFAEQPEALAIIRASE
jgi:cytochrome c-type biogenesis protein CcmH